ncbi:hypothetical protein GH714_029722 [Hevea brasiliensis]|uniref:NTF2 domain-containing protein n=1 Tax=Hevea brasiliensis TaxID=3981 RepID=A0A6A6KY12_HEVBR|nr:hypothetical protein GH714_029722 [Hevea brasiliensis]
MDPDAVAKAFVEHYYTTFDANRAGLANLYQDGSMLTFEGQKIQAPKTSSLSLLAFPSSSASTASPPSIVSPRALPVACSSLSPTSSSPANNMLSSSARFVIDCLWLPVEVFGCGNLDLLELQFE